MERGLSEPYPQRWTPSTGWLGRGLSPPMGAGIMREPALAAARRRIGDPQHLPLSCYREISHTWS